jgi:uncharacterized protein YqhQ
MSEINSNADTPKINPTLNTLQIIFEIAVILGYTLGILGGFVGLYYVAMFWVIPATIANLIFAFNQNNRTQTYTLVNLVMSLVTLIPFIGFFSAITGIIMSAISTSRLLKYSKELAEKPPESGFTDVQEVPKK